MNGKEVNARFDQVIYVVGVAIRGPITSGDYEVGKAKINVSYPPRVDFGFPTPIELPKGLSTVFEVAWPDKGGATAKKLHSKGAERHHPIHYALDRINELLLAYKLVRVGHAEGIGIRTIGIGDTLFHFSLVNDQYVGNLNMGLKISPRDYSWAYPNSKHPDDLFGTTELAKPHIATSTYPTARRYVRCFELLEHGFYTEALIVAFSILDDLVQEMLHALLREKGMESRTARNEFLRGIKENRLRLFLGPLLKVLSGKAINEIWADAETALGWLNQKRNSVAHSGYQADHSTAAKAIYACIKTIVVLRQHELVEAEFPVDMFRHAKVTAAWSEDPPKWVPEGEDAVSSTFD